MATRLCVNHSGPGRITSLDLSPSLSSASNSTRNPTLWFNFTHQMVSHLRGRRKMGLTRKQKKNEDMSKPPEKNVVLYTNSTEIEIVPLETQICHTHVWKYQFQKQESSKTRMPKISHDGASAPFFCWLWLPWWIPVWLRWIVCELWSVKAILVYIQKNRSQGISATVEIYKIER